MTNLREAVRNFINKTVEFLADDSYDYPETGADPREAFPVATTNDAATTTTSDPSEVK